MRGKKDEVPVKSVKKALDMLSILLFDNPRGNSMRLKTLAQKQGISVKTAHNLLKTMAACGYIEKDGFGNYTTGCQCRKIAYRNQTATCRFQSRVTDTLLRHVKEIGEGMTYILLENNVWTTFVNVGPRGDLQRPDVETVRRFYLYETATGKVIFAFSSPERRQLLMEENGMPEFYWPDYEDEVKRIRTRGYCITLRKRYRTYSYAVPVFAPGGEIAGALGVYTLPEHAGESRDRIILAHLKRAAASVMRHLRCAGNGF